MLLLNYRQLALVGLEIENLPRFSFLAGLLGQKTRLRLPMGFLMARCAEGDQILGSVIAQSAARLNVMDSKTLFLTKTLFACYFNRIRRCHSQAKRDSSRT